jgi:type IV secretion system protein VirB3
MAERLEEDTLYLAATRPALFAGVPLPVAGAFLMLAGFVIVILQNPLYELVMLPLWFGARVVVSRDYNAVNVVYLYLLTAARGVDVLLTRQCVIFAIVMTRHTPDPRDPDEPLLAWFNAAVDEHKHDIADMIEGLGDAYWGLPASRRWAARRLVRMWERGGAEAFRDLSASLAHKPVLP